jgi:hypothetical protein
MKRVFIGNQENMGLFPYRQDEEIHTLKFSIMVLLTSGMCLEDKAWITPKATSTRCFASVEDHSQRPVPMQDAVVVESSGRTQAGQ